MAQSVNEKLPSECCNLAEVRSEIDNIDLEIIKLLATRSKYVREVVKYKDGTASGIKAPERRAEVLLCRREWAQEAGLDPDVIEHIYDTLIQYFINEEMKLIEKV